MTEEECHTELSAWMDKQDDSVIRTPRSQWQKDVNQVIKDIYDKRPPYSPKSYKSNLYITKEIIIYIYEHTQVKSERIVLLLMIINQMRFENDLEDGGFRASAKQIAHDANIGISAAKSVPLKLAANNHIRRETQKPTNRAVVKASSLFGNLPSWYTLNNTLLNMIYEASTDPDKQLKMTFGSNLYQQMNFYLHQCFEEYEIKQWLKRDAYNTSEQLYKDYCIEHIMSKSS